MKLQSNPNKGLTPFANKLALLVLLFLFNSFIAVPVAQAACPGTDGTGSDVVFESCTEAKGSSNVAIVNLDVPAGVVSGDMLLAVISVDGNETFDGANGWELLFDENGGGGNTLAVYKRISNGLEPSDYDFTWSTTERVYAYMLHFTGINGNTIHTTNTGSGSSPQAPSVTTTSVDNMILRLGGFDQHDLIVDPTTIITGHTNITQDWSEGDNNPSVSGAAAYENQTAIGASGTANFSLTANEGWVTASIAIEPGSGGTPTPTPFFCPGIDGSTVAGQLVVFEQCTVAKVTTNNGNNFITIVTPTQASLGQFMVAVVAIEDNDANNTITEPLDWNVIYEGATNNGITLGVYSKLVFGTEDANYTWTNNDAEQFYGYIMLFSGASGYIESAFDDLTSTNAIQTNMPIATQITTNIANTLVVSLSVHDDDDIDTSLTQIVVGQNNLVNDASNTGNGTVSSMAVYLNEAAVGTTAGVDFPLFLGSVNEQWISATLGIEPWEYRISHSGNLSVCTVEEVTISVTDSVGNPVPNYVGSITLSNTGGHGDWSIGPSSDLGLGTLDNLTADDGIATYQFVEADAGEVTFAFSTDTEGVIGFNLVDSIGRTENSFFDPDLTIDNICEIRIEHDNTAGTCAIEAITVTIVDSSGDAALNYIGTVDISLDLGSGGDYSTVALGTLNNGIANDGIASYTFVASDSGSVVLNYANTLVQSVNFNAVDTTNGYITDTDLPASYDANLVINDCEIRITLAGATSDVCSVAQVSFSVTDSTGAVVTSYIGTITVATDSSTGSWSDDDGTNAVVDTIAGDGVATYTFAAGDLGTVNLLFSNPFIDADISFDGSATQIATNGSFDPDLAIVACTILIDADDNQADICRAGEVVTYTIRDRNGAIATNYTGTLVLTTDTSNGDYAPSGEFGTFDNGTANDGIATYVFDGSDNGVLSVVFTDNDIEMVTLTAAASGFTVDVASDGNITVEACEFRISLIDATPAASDVCSIEAVRISLFDAAGTAVTDYTGTINLSTTTGNGTWSVNSADGILTDPLSEDGFATYAFLISDLGTIDLNFTDTINETVNINVSDGVTTDPGDSMDPNDPDILVSLCTFEISHTQTVSACAMEAVTFTVRDSIGNVAVNYTGTMTISTSNNFGNWTVNTGTNSISDTPGDDDGAASYSFDTADNGVVILDYENLHAGTHNIDVIDGVIVENGAFDEDLTVQSCFPAVAAQSCVAGGSHSTNISIDAQDSNASYRGRMVVMVTNTSEAADVTSAVFNSVTMTLIYQEKNSNGFGNTTEMWGILDADLPVAAGSYTGTYVGSNLDPSMCLFYLTDLEQAFPQVDVMTPSAGAVNGTQQENAATTTTTVTSTANNSLILSVVGNGDNQESYSSLSPDPPLTRLFNGPNPSFGTFAGSSGVNPSAAAITVNETSSYTPDRDSHIVASFAPLISGPPIAVGFVPVILFQTYSGNVSYRAIGSALRTDSNVSGPEPFGCQFVNFATGTTANLNMPGGSTVTQAWLYWTGSGDDALGQVDSNVTFTDPSLTATAVTADDIFLIDNVGLSNNLDYFVGYKDVTALVTGSGDYTLSDFTVQNGSPWNLSQACAGGWSLIVVYDNAFEELKVINLFHGFQPFQDSSFTLVPRNFRMAARDPSRNLPNGQVTHFTIEGDDTLDNGDESLSLQDTPGGTTYTTLLNSYNPLQSEFNSTITRPIYFLDTGVTDVYQFDSTAGPNGDGYEIDVPGTAGRLGDSFGVDLDTHYLQGANLGELLYEFAAPGSEAEEITTRYSTGQDLVMLVNEVISITNAPIADIEIFNTQVGSFSVGGTGSYQIQVRNNGSGATVPGYADGEIIVTEILPTGMTLASAGDVVGDGWNCSVVTLDPGAFSCVFDISSDWTLARGAATLGQLAGTGEYLPTITVNVVVGDFSDYPNLDNTVKSVARVLHSGGSCPALLAGVSPDPDLCVRAPQFDNVNDLDGGAIDINDLDDKTLINNNVASVTGNVRGIETDLTVDKFVNGVLEEGSGTGEGQYTIRVTNLGPDATTSPLTVSDAEPAGVTFISAAGTDWSCSSVSPTLNCTYNAVAGLAVFASTDLLVDVTVTGSAGDNVTNTVIVTPGAFNFDPNSANDTDITTIVAPAVSSQEKFLISVSALGNDTSIGGLDNFENHDLIIYDPVLDTAVMFFDNSALGFGVDDANAVHLMKNGHIVLSANGSINSIGSNTLAFDESDLVVYDPILGTAILLFDGSAIFTDAGENIDAVYIKDNGNIVFSTTDDASIGGTSFNRSDLVEYNPNTGIATILLEGSDSDVFAAADVQVDAVYLRVDPADPTGVINTTILSTDDASATIGAGGDPMAGTVFTRDDLVELDQTGATETEKLFVGDLPLGVFTAADPQRRLDAVHVIEDGYHGHFSIAQSQAGSTCAAGKITITKHEGLTHNADTDYYGSILISTDIGSGTWSIDTGNGTLIDTGSGTATYTFVASDNGQVTLNLATDTVSTINVNVTNSFVTESGAEDPNFSFNNVLTAITYRDEFTTVAFDRNDGSTIWASDWVEVDDEGVGPASGNVSISGGVISLTSTPATTSDPSISRTADLSLYTVTEDVFVNFDYSYASLNASDALVIEARDDSGDGFTTVATLTGLSGTNASFTAASYNLSTALAPASFTSTTEIRFRISNGYTLSSVINLDNIELSTGTTDCGIGVIDHYEIRIDNTTGNSATLVNGIACVGSSVTITGHDSNHFPAAPGELITMRTDTSKGAWVSVLTGGGSFSTGNQIDGVGQYSFVGGESLVTFRFNYTSPTTDPELVNFNIDSGFPVFGTEDPTLQVNQAGLLFYDEGNNNTTFPVFPTQIAGKPSDVGFRAKTLTIEAVRTSDSDPQACSPLFDAANTLSIGFAVECVDSGNCSPGITEQPTINGSVISLVDDDSGSGAAAYTQVDIDFIIQPNSGHPAGTIALNYADAGQVQLHAQYAIPLDDGSSDPAQGTLDGSSNVFIVRPFGFDIDFSDTRAEDGFSSRSYAADADGSRFATAGVGFDTTLTAVLWQQGDDANDDGMPDSNAILADNLLTPNYGNESTAADYDVLVSSQLVAPVGGVDGVLSANLFTTFSNGVSTQSMTFDEVGIINLSAQLVDSNDGSDPNSFMGPSSDEVGYSADDLLIGNVAGVGRFVPADFLLSGGMIASRVLADDIAACIAPSTFTYMGEEFGISVDVTARNGAGTPQITRNYVGSFARLGADTADNRGDFVVENFSAVEEVAGVDDDYSDRLSDPANAVNPSTGINRILTWNTDPNADGGEGVLTGNFIFNRQTSGAEDGPFNSLTIAVYAEDEDDVENPQYPPIPVVRDLDVDDVAPDDVSIISTEDFRYGRLTLENSYGPETEPLDIPFRVEYFNGSYFVLNTDDSCTTLFMELSAVSSAIDYVDLSYGGALAEGETSIVGTADVTMSLFEGETGQQASGADLGLDSPMESSAPGVDNQGSVVVELNLSDSSLNYSLDFLTYDWRSPGEIEDDTTDGIYSDNPRALLEFGSYRGHDRVLNWQELIIID